MLKKTKSQYAQEICHLIETNFWKWPGVRHLHQGRRWLDLGPFHILRSNVPYGPRGVIPRLDVWLGGQGKVMSACWPPFHLISMKPAVWVPLFYAHVDASSKKSKTIKTESLAQAFADGVGDGGHSIAVLKAFLESLGNAGAEIVLGDG